MSSLHEWSDEKLSAKLGLAWNWIAELEEEAGRRYPNSQHGKKDLRPVCRKCAGRVTLKIYGKETEELKENLQVPFSALAYGTPMSSLTVKEDTQ